MRCFCACRFCFSAERVFATMAPNKGLKIARERATADSTGSRGCQRGAAKGNLDEGHRFSTTLSERFFLVSVLSPLVDPLLATGSNHPSVQALFQLRPCGIFSFCRLEKMIFLLDRD